MQEQEKIMSANHELHDKQQQLEQKLFMSLVMTPMRGFWRILK